MHERRAAAPAGRGYPGPLDAGLSGTGLVADDLYLLAHDDRSGRPLLPPRPLGTGLAGGIDGRVYEADACPACAARLRGVLEQFASRAGRAAVLPDLLPGGPWLGRPPQAAGSRMQRRGSAGLRRLRR